MNCGSAVQLSGLLAWVVGLRDIAWYVYTINIVGLTFVPAGANVAHAASLDQCCSTIVSGSREPLRTICAAKICTGVVAAQQIIALSSHIDIAQSGASTRLVWVFGAKH